MPNDPTLWAALRSAYRQIDENRLALIAAGVAFFSMLSLFPALAALIAVLSLIADPVVVVEQLEELNDLLPSDVYDILNAQVVGLVSASPDQLGWTGFVSIAVAFWSARTGVGAMMLGLNAVYGQPNRTSIAHYTRALLLTLVLVTLGMIALLALVVAPVVLAFLPLGAFSAWVLEILRWVIAIAVIFFGIGLLYRFGAHRTGVPVHWFTPGAVFSVIAWAGLSLAFSYYVANFGTYNEVYGSIGAVIAMLIWLWISSFLVLFGAALNVGFQRGD